jgi:hypothetical protein
MTDTNTFFRTTVVQTGQFIAAYEAMLLVMDKLATDPTLAAAAAQSANAGGRTDLSTASFQQLQEAISLIQTLMNTSQPPLGGNFTKMPFYEMV